MSALTYKSYTIPAYQTISVAVTGAFFYCTASSAPFTMNFDGGEDIDCEAGFIIPWKSGFKAVNIKNETANALSVSFYVASDGISFVPPLLPIISTDAPTYAKGSGIKNLAANGKDDYTGVDSAHVRRSFSATNLDTDLALQVLDASGRVLVQIPALTGWQQFVSGQVSVKNPNGGAAVNYVVSEVFYA